MKSLVYICLIFIACNLYANDAWVESAGGSYRIIGDKNEKIQMVREAIEINMYNDYYEMRIFFVFHNNGDTVVLDVGFPEYSFGTQKVTTFSNFRTSINGNWVDARKVGNNQENNSYIKINAWYVKQVEFIANRDVTSVVEYRANYAGYGNFNSIEYLYGTGGTWKDNIGKIDIEIINHTDYWIREFNSEIKTSVKTDNDDGVIRIQALNVVPEENDTFSVIFGNEPLFINYFNEASDPFVLDKRIIDNEKLILLSDYQLRILRNSLYANHGYIFNSQDLRDYFNKYKLHRPNGAFSENDFSEIEKTNLKNIIDEENWRK
jgi:hypothetical protein